MRIRTTVLAALGAGGLLLTGVAPSAHGADPTGWVLYRTHIVEGVVGLALDPVTGTTLFAPFAPNQPPGHVTTVRSTDWSEIDTVPAGRFPNFTNDSVDEATGRTYVASFGDAAVLVIDNATGEVLHTYTKTNWMPFSTAVDDTRNLAYVVDGNDNNLNPTGSITVLDGATDTEVISVPADDLLVYPAVSPKHQRLYVPVEGPAGVLVFDTSTNQVVGHIKGSGEETIEIPLLAVVDDELDRVFVLQYDQLGQQLASIAVIDSTTDEVAGPAIEFGRIFTGDSSMAYDPVHKQLVVAGKDVDDGRLYIITIDALTGSVVSRTEFVWTGSETTFWGLAIDPQARRLVAATTYTVNEYEWREPALPATGAPSALPAIAVLAALALLAGIALATARRSRRSH